MSEEEDDELRAFGAGYGIDMQYDFNVDGTVDLLIDETGDIRLVGGTVSDSMEVRRKNAIQKIVLSVLTPLGALQSGPTFGSNLHSLVGSKDTDLTKMAVRAYVLSCLADYPYLERVVDIVVGFPKSGVMTITLKIKLIDDSTIIEEMITLGG